MSEQDTPELRRLRRELMARFDAHPGKTWSSSLITAMIALIDLAFEGENSGNGGPEDGGRPRLTVVQ